MNEYSPPIAPRDFILEFLEHIVNWLDSWVSMPFVSGKLAEQTITSFRHTCEALQMLFKQLTDKMLGHFLILCYIYINGNSIG